jgi:hypothetical protein
VVSSLAGIGYKVSPLRGAGLFPRLTMNDFSNIAWQAATVALIVIAMRWLGRARGAESPKVRVGGNIYGIKWQVRLVGYSGALFFVGVIIWFRRDLASAGDETLAVIMFAFGLLGLWYASGSITTDERGVTKKGFFLSRSFRWDDITEVRLHKRDGGAIELRAGSQKVIVDSRFAASHHLLEEIIAQTKLQPRQDS